MKGIYFDGNKDNILFQELKGSKMYKRTIQEKHISIIQEPGGIYLGQMTLNKRY